MRDELELAHAHILVVPFLLHGGFDFRLAHRVYVPAYFRLAELILNAVNHHKKELTAILEQTLPAETRILLDGLFVQNPALDARSTISSASTFCRTVYASPTIAAALPRPARQQDNAPCWSCLATGQYVNS